MHGEALVQMFKSQPDLVFNGCFMQSAESSDKFGEPADLGGLRARAENTMETALLQHISKASEYKAMEVSQSWKSIHCLGRSDKSMIASMCISILFKHPFSLHALLLVLQYTLESHHGLHYPA